MKRDQILKVFRNLAQSQGLYGRILRNIDEMSEEEKNSLFELLESQNFKDSVDLVMYVEG